MYKIKNTELYFESRIFHLHKIFYSAMTREQIEDSILKYNPTLIFVEHDTTFVEKVATKIITIEK